MTHVERIENIRYRSDYGVAGLNNFLSWEMEPRQLIQLIGS